MKATVSRIAIFEFNKIKWETIFEYWIPFLRSRLDPVAWPGQFKPSFSVKRHELYLSVKLVGFVSFSEISVYSKRKQRIKLHATQPMQLNQWAVHSREKKTNGMLGIWNEPLTILFCHWLLRLQMLCTIGIKVHLNNIQFHRIIHFCTGDEMAKYPFPFGLHLMTGAKWKKKI